MSGTRLGWMTGMAVAVGLALPGCQDAIDRVSPTDPPVGARRFPTPHPLPIPRVQPASQPQIRLELDDYSTSGDHLVIHNQSDGALHDLRVVVNHDYAYTMPVLLMGEAVRVPDAYLQTDRGQPFPTDRQIRFDRVEVYYQGRQVGLFDRRERMR